MKQSSIKYCTWIQSQKLSHIILWLLHPFNKESGPQLIKSPTPNIPKSFFATSIIIIFDMVNCMPKGRKSWPFVVEQALVKIKKWLYLVDKMMWYGLKVVGWFSRDWVGKVSLGCDNCIVSLVLLISLWYVLFCAREASSSSQYENSGVDMDESEKVWISDLRFEEQFQCIFYW